MRTTLCCMLVCCAVVSLGQLSSPVDLSDSFTDALSFVVVDFEGDGDMDLIADDGEIPFWAGHQRASVFVLYENDGSGNFAEHELIDLGELNFRTWGDFDDDGFVDLCTISSYYPSDSPLSIMIRFGQAGFTLSAPEAVYTLPPNFEPSWGPYVKYLQAGDVDSDGDDDLMMVANFPAGDPYPASFGDQPYGNYIKWNGSGFDEPLFIHQIDFAYASSPYETHELRVTDISNDGINDILYSEGPDFGADLVVYYGEGEGAFATDAVYYFPGTDGYDFTNMDEDDDLESVFHFEGNIARYDNDGVALHEQFGTPIFIRSIALLDSDGDGLKDVVGAISDSELSGDVGKIGSLLNTGNADEDWPLDTNEELAGVDIRYMGVGQFDGQYDRDIIVVGDGHLYLFTTALAEENIPVANFSAGETDICDESSVTFTDASSASATSWEWTFEGGNPSSYSGETPPAILYSTPGSYDVTLTVSNVDGEDTEVKTDFIIVSAASPYYRDFDGDGYGNSSVMLLDCTPPVGYVNNATDCNDNNSAVKPGATEVCNSIDDDCDSSIDEGVTTTYYRDTDNDGYGTTSITLQACSPPAGYVLNSTDCNDGVNGVHPNATEACNGVDDDCDGSTDEGVLSTFYADSDGDGFGNAASSTLACSAPAGYVANSTDCNDNINAVHPGANELCNGMDDDCDNVTDEGCPQLILNDSPAGALTIPVNPTNTTTITSGNLTNATASSQAQTTAVTGQDLWYKFTAPSPGIRIRTQSTVVNLLVELQTIDGVLIDSENIRPTVGNEFLNFGNLVEGQQYRVAVRNYNSAQGTGLFTISANYFNDSELSTVAASYQYCSSITAIHTGTSAYRFDLVSATTSTLYQETVGGSNSVRLSMVDNLPAGDTYYVSIHPMYHTTNGLGAAEVVTVGSTVTNTIVVAPFAVNQLRAADACPIARSATAIVQSTATICGAVDYQWEFTKMLPVEAAPVLVMRGASSINFPLTSLPASAGSTYIVRIRPLFPNGMYGNWGNSVCLKTASSGMVAEDEGEMFEAERFETSLNGEIALFTLFPNPGNGENVMVRFHGEEDQYCNVGIFDMSGKLVHSESYMATLNSPQKLSSTENLTSGIYLVEISTQADLHTGRLIINR